MPYVAGVSEKLQRIFGQHKIPVYFKPVNTLRQKLVHPKDKVPNYKQSNVVYAIRCKEEDCDEHYIGNQNKSWRRDCISIADRALVGLSLQFIST